MISPTEQCACIPKSLKQLLRDWWMSWVWVATRKGRGEWFVLSSTNPNAQRHNSIEGFYENWSEME